MEPDHFHSPLFGCLLRFKRTQNKRYSPGSTANQYVRQAYCRIHKITLCFCGWEYGWHYGISSEPILPAQIPSKPVLQFSLDGGLIAEHPSIGSASRTAGLTPYSIKLCMQGRIRMAGGYVWKAKAEPSIAPSSPPPSDSLPLPLTTPESVLA